MSKKNFLFQKKSEDPDKLFEFLKQKIVVEKKIRFADEMIKTYVHEGFVRVDDKLVKDFNAFVKPDVFVSIVIRIKDIKKTQKPPQAEMHLKFEDILYEDRQIIVVQKPAGIPTHPMLDPDRDNLVAALKRYLLVRDGVVPYLGLHHRLDKDTSGLILLTKKQSVNKAVSDLFSERKIKKNYVAVTVPKKLDQKKWTIENNLARSHEDKKLVRSVREGGDLAITQFAVLKESKEALMIQAQPETGRTHQIRVHLFEDSLPILGDVLYHSGGSEKYDRLYLHAWQLEFPHPVTKQKLLVESPVPAEFQKFF